MVISLIISHTWGPTTSCIGYLFNNLLDDPNIVEYFDSLPKAIATIETVSLTKELK